MPMIHDDRCAHLRRTINLPDNPARSLYPSATSVICASNVAHIVRDGDDRTSSKYNASNYPVHTILSQAEPKRALRFLTIAEIDRFINVFKEGESTLIGSMPTENEIMTADLWSIIGETSQDESSGTQISKPQEVLAALNKDGVLELFPQPFDFGSSPATNPSQSFKDRMKGRTRKPFAQIRTVRPDKRAMRIPLIDVSFDGNFLNLAWADGGVNVVFEKIQWRDDETGHMTVSGLTEITKSKSGAGLGAVGLNGVKDVGKSQVDDSQAVVTNGAESNETSSEAGENEAIEASSSEKDSDSEEDQEPPDQSALVKKAESDNSDGDVSMNDAEDAEGEQAENDGNHVDAKEPTSFGDLLKANARSTIDVSTALALSHEPQSLAPTHGNPPSTLQPAYQGLSLGTVLTQALRTNDTALLETCFHTHDLANIRATVERLESSFASTLLQKLAERLHNRPGRAGSLMVWIQWTLVAHGGYLAGQPDVMRKLRGLQRVVKERASSLRELLGLKGKLDMLEAQMNLRRSMIQRRRRVQDQKNDDEIDEAVIYVEGQDEEEDNEQDSSDDSDDEKEEEEEDSDAEDEDKTNNLSLKKSRSKSKPNPKSIKPTKPTRTRVSPSGNEDESEEDEDGDGDLNKTSINGISAPASASDDADPNSDSDSNDNNLLDDEASSTSGYGSGSTSDQDGEIDHEDVDTDSDSASNSDSDSASDIDIDPDIDGEAPASAPASASMSSSPDPDSTRGLESKRAVKKAKTGKGKGKGKGR